MKSPTFRLSLNGHYKLNVEAEAEIEKMKLKNTKLLRKVKLSSYLLNAMPFIVFFMCYPIAALVSFILQISVDSTFYIVAPAMLVGLYASMKKLVKVQEAYRVELEKNIDDAVRETEEIIYRSPVAINETDEIDDGVMEAANDSEVSPVSDESEKQDK